MVVAAGGTTEGLLAVVGSGDGAAETADMAMAEMLLGFFTVLAPLGNFVEVSQSSQFPSPSPTLDAFIILRIF